MRLVRIFQSTDLTRVIRHHLTDLLLPTEPWVQMDLCAAGPPLKVPLTMLMAHHEDTWRAVQVL